MAEEIYVPRLQAMYRDKIAPDLAKQFNYSNPMMVPKLQKVVLNMGIGAVPVISRRLMLTAGSAPRPRGTI